MVRRAPETLIHAERKSSMADGDEDLQGLFTEAHCCCFGALK
jgi:hypothetical protein